LEVVEVAEKKLVVWQFLHFALQALQRAFQRTLSFVLLFPLESLEQ
jgi:hypothetical protein